MTWELTSHEKLAAAGYLFRRKVPCRRCHQPVLLYAKPRGGVMAIEPGSYQPHRASCQPKPRTDKNQESLF